MEIRLKDFKKGQTVWVRLNGNASIGKTGAELIEEWEVMAVGRKYLTAKKKGSISYSSVKFVESDIPIYEGRMIQYTNYCKNYIIYETKEEILEEIETEKLRIDVYDFFRYGRKKTLNKDQLEKIMDIIKESDDKNGLE